ncbi:hypothetical protein PDN64_13315 [Bacillus cereus group sp. Bc256]|uniref:hypothetical protein n=1 Tax=unclassified Bacillus cereus group TaxID=2750818 RepID=UPI001F592ABC|nr:MULTISPECIES: hypothetical protein [unclassified Bacillus cereus group]MDA2139102.1 hypothetical protein [Bacillus cereus group sp. Bc256]MDA2598490.1 hypothetical protein [Bacillus cereus group sp. Bc061]
MMTEWVLSGRSKYYYLSTTENMKNSKGEIFKKGQMITGWLQDKEAFYYLSPKQTTGYRSMPIAEGEMVINWFEIDGRWYYFSRGEDGVDTQNYAGAKFALGEMWTGWLQWVGLKRTHRYYLDKSSGHMIKNNKITIKGIDLLFLL